MALPLIHPGEILREKLATLDVKAAELSRQINVPANRLTQIMKGLRGITGDTALRLGHWFETDPYFWMQLQSAYDIRLAAQTGHDIAALPTHTTRNAEQGARHAVATMQTIAINNQSGGVGKTMLAVHLAWYLAEGGARVLFVDLDSLGSATKVLQDERQIGLAADIFEAGAKMPSTAEVGISVMGRDDQIERVQGAQVSNVVRNFRSIATVFDYCVVDTPPAWDARNVAAMAVCDHLLAPIGLTSFAIDGVGRLVRSIQAVEDEGRQGRPINFLGLIASRFNSRDAGEHGRLKAVREKLGANAMLSGVITVRHGYEQAMNDRVPVWTIETSGAKVAGAEIRAILANVRQRINGTQGAGDEGGDGEPLFVRRPEEPALELSLGDDELQAKKPAKTLAAPKPKTEAKPVFVHVYVDGRAAKVHLPDMVDVAFEAGELGTIPASRIDPS